MQTYSYYSRMLLIEYLQKTIFFKIWKTLNKGYYSYFILNNKNRLFITYNTNNWILKWYVKYENRYKLDFLIYSMVVKNNFHLESFVNYIDKYLEEHNLKKWFSKIDIFEKLDFDLNI